MEPGAALFLFLAVGAASMFSFIAVASWVGARHAERETFYRTELIKKAVDSPASATALEFLRERDREHERLRAVRQRSAIRLGGLVTTAAGLGLMVSLHEIITDKPIHLAALIPIFVGAALFGYSFFTAKE
jgi:ferric-dicitrate binding protein FerR (iron transport regulator)